MEKKFRSSQYPDTLIRKVVLRAIKTNANESATVWKLPRQTVVGWVEAHKSGRVDIESHLHHWDLPTPSGPVVRGKCRACLEERDFRTSTDFRGWKQNKNDDD